MQIILNGRVEETRSSTIAELVSELKLAADSLVVEHNRSIVRQDAWAETALRENDELELLNFVGGG